MVFQKFKGILDLAVHPGQDQIAPHFPDLLVGRDQKAPAPATDGLGLGQVQQEVSFVPCGYLEAFIHLYEGLGVEETFDFQDGHIWKKRVMNDVDRNGFHGILGNVK
jgi:hypothetical protein